MNYNVEDIALSFNEHPVGKISLIFYFTGCNKALSGKPCICNGIICHNPSLWHKIKENYKTEKEILSILGSYLDDNLLKISSFIFCGGEPLDSIPELNSLSDLLFDKYPDFDQVLFTHHKSLPKNLNVSHLTWVKYGEWGSNQWYINLTTNERIELYDKDVKLL